MTVTFSDDVEEHEITPYSEIYGHHPSKFVVVRNGFKMVRDGSDRFTGKSDRVMRRRANFSVGKNENRLRLREVVLRNTIEQGAAWEVQTDARMMVMAAIKATKRKVNSRIGAKKVKKFEQLLSPGEALSPDEATAFRALSARANYLAQDRPDLAFAAKELCREFANPSRQSYGKLKRVARYLLGKPRLVWRFDFQDPVSELQVMVDTDFAGCQKTRRSTSGGCAQIGGHLIKAWSTTQTTIALSSGEAELTGIVKGAAQAIGLRSVAADLGMKWSLHLRTDATAAIGICRRKGLGKIRHLAVADLWVQDKLKTGDFQLSKIPGLENPGDLFTKYLDARSADAHVGRLNLVTEEGRAKSAPALPKSELQP